MWIALLAACGTSAPGTTGASTPPPTSTPASTTIDTSTLDTHSLDTHSNTSSNTDTVDTGPPGPWRHTIVVDGDLSDWSTSDEGFATPDGTNFITWDDTHLYIGVHHPDTARHESNNWLFLHVGNGGDGSRLGLSWESQLFTPPFDAKAIVITEVGMGSDSTTYDWLGTDGSEVAQQDTNEALELAIPLAMIGATEHLDLLMHLMDEAHPSLGGGLWCYAPTPAEAFTDGDCLGVESGVWLSIDLTASLPPTAHEVR
jgi:hypothetical protein